MLTGMITAGIKAALEGNVDIGTVKHSVDRTFARSFSDGSGAGQATQMWTDTRTIAASSSENIDLAGVIINALGQVATFTSIKAIWIVAAQANTNNVVIGGAAANAFPLFGDPTDTHSVKPGGLFLVTDFNANGWLVTAGTGDILKIANSGAGSSVAYDIIVIGD